MLLRRLSLLLLPLLLLVAAATAAPAQQPAPEAPPATAQSPAAPVSAPLKVGVFVDPPFVIARDGTYVGMAADLWQHIANGGGLDYRYVPFPSIETLLEATTAGQIDIAVGGLTITEGRLQRMDFSQPWYSAGLRVMIEEQRGSGIGELIAGLAAGGHLRIYLWIIGVVLVATVLLTLIDRWFDPEFPRRWHEGMAESFYHVMSVATSGKASHKQLFGVVGKVLAAVWMVCGVTLVAYITSSITSVMTTNAITSQIGGFADLSGRTVGVLRGSVGEGYCREMGISVVPYDDLDAAVQGLLAREVRAVVHDAPALEYYDRTHPTLPITEVGASIHHQMMGFPMPQGSALVRPVSRGIVAATDAGLVEQLRAHYLVKD